MSKAIVGLLFYTMVAWIWYLEDWKLALAVLMSIVFYSTWEHIKD